jgi:hypothetical protein
LQVEYWPNGGVVCLREWDSFRSVNVLKTTKQFNESNRSREFLGTPRTAAFIFFSIIKTTHSLLPPRINSLKQAQLHTSLVGFSRPVDQIEIMSCLSGQSVA